MSMATNETWQQVHARNIGHNRAVAGPSSICVCDDAINYPDSLWACTRALVSVDDSAVGEEAFCLAFVSQNDPSEPVIRAVDVRGNEPNARSSGEFFESFPEVPK